MNKKLGFLSFGALWFGAAISLAELMTGGLLASAGFKSGLAAILVGHLIGTVILILGGYIGIVEKLPSIEGTKASFGEMGTKLFALLNIIQLIGWTTIMIIIGARTLNDVTSKLWEIDNFMLWSVTIGLLIVIWIWLGLQGFKYLNTIAGVLLLILTLILSISVLSDGSLFASKGDGNISFGTMVELNVVMPLSWLPLIADYTRLGKSKRGALGGSFIGYFIGSSWMYIIGLALAITKGSADISGVLIASKLGIAAAGIIMLSTITTTFMDAYSAGVTSLNITKKISERGAAIAVTVLATFMALFFPMEQYENFLYAIGSVFAPLFAVVLTDYFIFKKKVSDGVKLDIAALITWVFGVVLYHMIKNMDIVIGVTVPVMILTSLVFTMLKTLLTKKAEVDIKSEA